MLSLAITIFMRTAAKVYKIDLKDVGSDMRRKAKTANFGIIYGISVFGLAERMNVDRKEAKELIDGYFETYPGVKAYMDKSIQVAHKRLCGNNLPSEALLTGHQFAECRCTRICGTKCHQRPYPGKCGRYYKSSNGTYLSTVPDRRNTSQNDPAST